MEDNFFDPDSDEDLDLPISEYDIIASPNDFNVLSYFNFIESGSIIIPGFQRHYVWDIRKASKLIESIIMGLPIPQIFLYEEERNKFLVIDGQQRLLTTYFFMKGRFPKREAKSLVRDSFNHHGRLPKNVLEDDNNFNTFKLKFSRGSAPSPYEGLTYASLDDLKSTFDLRTIRNIMVKQIAPNNDKSSIFELFNRLNTGGMNLSQQEIRMSLYYGPFVKDVAEMNRNENWRDIIGSPPDQRQKDVEIILRMLALAESYDKFKKPLSKFINDFCDDNRKSTNNNVYSDAFSNFAMQLSKIDRDLYLQPKSRRISVPIIESVFVASNEEFIKSKGIVPPKPFDSNDLMKIRSSSKFDKYFTEKTTDVDAVKGRINLAKSVI